MQTCTIKRALPAKLEMAVRHALSCYPDPERAVAMLRECIKPHDPRAPSTWEPREVNAAHAELLDRWATCASR